MWAWAFAGQCRRHARIPLAANQRAGSPPPSSGSLDADRQRPCERFHVHRERVFLAGYESGGTMACASPCGIPSRFAAAVSIGGPFPQGTLLARIAQLRKSPLLLAHCRDSQTYPVDRVCQELLCSTRPDWR